tara:strand:- start:1365 stop:2990 length:1626 start_codon:yes stop_codon:yes gene_type:complete
MEVVTIFLISSVLATLINSEPALFFKFLIEKGYSFNQNTVGIIVLFVITSSMLSVLTNIILVQFTHNLGASISNNLTEKFTMAPWKFHVEKNTSDLINSSILDVTRLTNLGIVPCMLIIPRILVLVLIISTLLISHTIETIIVFLIFLTFYFTIIKIFINKVRNYGEILSSSNEGRIRVLSEVFTSFKEVKAYSVEDFFIKKFNELSKKFSKSYAGSQLVSILPRFIIEGIVFVTIVLFFWINLDNNQEKIFTIEVITLFGVAALKLLPGFQAIFSYISGFNSIETIVKKTIHYLKMDVYDFRKDKINLNKTRFEKLEAIKIEVEVAGEGKFKLGPINLSIKQGEVIGLMGESAAGKSTLVDSLIGFYTKSSGKFLINGKKSDGLIQSGIKISYVSQTVPILDGTLIENIVFGRNNYNEAMIKQAIEISNLTNFVESMPNGLNSQIGENGISISGGQRQRIGIARAILDNPDLIIFDESTSALDKETEKKLIETFKVACPNACKIIIGHNWEVFKYTNIIYEMKSGKISRSLHYKDLKKYD